MTMELENRKPALSWSGGEMKQRRSSCHCLIRTCLIGLALLSAGTGKLQAGALYLPNASFESPVVPQVNPYAEPDMDYWQKSPQPAWYYPSNNFDTPWEDLMGTFYNVQNPSSFIDNCDGVQASFIFALPEAAVFQDYTSVSGTNTTPSHAFNAKFNVGRAYNLAVGLIGGGGGMQPGATFQISLYYRDPASNIVTVAATTVTNSTALFPTNTHFVNFQVHVPAVKPGDAWAGKNIGVQLASTVGFDIPGGYWDVDNVRLAEVIDVPNGSFESPVVPQAPPYAEPDIDAWQKSPQPAWYYPSNNFDTPWDYLMGTFYNVPNPGSFIDNCDGVQASFMFAVPEVALFQDYNTISGTNTTPSHALNAAFTVGKRYRLTVGLIGGGGGMQPGVTFQISLYYRDASSNMVTVAATSITNTTANFPTNTHLVDFQVQVPGVQAGDPWAGKNIGIQLLSTAGFDNAGGYWDVDNVRLTEVVENELVNPGLTNGHFQMIVRSEPGLTFEILASTNLPLTASNWASLGTVTNITGATPFLDSSLAGSRRFYRARQMP
jgi:hypothetical protein